jgi:surface antigen
VIVGALAAPHDPGLDELLGAAGAQALRAELAARARRWAAEVAPDRAFEATTLGAAEAALVGHDGPVLLAAPDVPALDACLARTALDDLAAGCDIALGAAHDARPYLLAVPRPDPALMALVGRSLEGGVLGAFAERGVTLGMLRHERRLVSAADARALAIDPSAPPDLAALVRGRLPESPRR